ncbi:hypothetical protein [Sphingomonas koreensis]|nr:hypothetical protein [Sphingomonas koreensis]MDC7809938.1 hypothetical protein [Sphingomonas koreensis]
MFKIVALVAAVIFAAPSAAAQVPTPLVGGVIPVGKVAPAVKLPKDAPRYLKTLNSEMCRKLFAYAKTGFSGVPHVSDLSIDMCNSALKEAKLAQQRRREAP